MSFIDRDDAGDIGLTFLTTSKELIEILKTELILNKEARKRQEEQLLIAKHKIRNVSKTLSNCLNDLKHIREDASDDVKSLCVGNIQKVHLKLRQANVIYKALKAHNKCLLEERVEIKKKLKLLHTAFDKHGLHVYPEIGW